MWSLLSLWVETAAAREACCSSGQLLESQVVASATRSVQLPRVVCAEATSSHGLAEWSLLGLGHGNGRDMGPWH